jgi:transcriptional regulator PpsR
VEAASSTGALPALRGIADPVAHRLVASGSDLALVVDGGGQVVDLWLGDAIEAHPGWQGLLGRPWSDTVLEDSKRKVEQLLWQAQHSETARAREINQRVDGVGSVPIRFSGARGEEDHVVLLGRDLRPLAELQQRMVSAQQGMDLEYRRLRQADTRYRVLFRVSGEAVLIVDGADKTIVEANPAAGTMFGAPVQALKGREIFELFSADSRDELLGLAGAVEAGARQHDVTVALDEAGKVEVAASATTFRQSGSVYLLFRIQRPGLTTSSSARAARLLTILETLPDGFVVTTEDLRIIAANSGFCELAQVANEAMALDADLGQWVGRPGVDLNIIVANLKEHGVVRNLSTIVRGDLGLEQEAVVTAVSALDGKVPCFGFTIRPVSSRMAEPQVSTFLPRSVDKLRALVGRVSLKEIVRESTDLIERLCIEAALDVSGNNRAAAAQLLGLSRQSLYSKLRRHGLAEFPSS